MNSFNIAPVTSEEIAALIAKLQGQASVVSEAPNRWTVKGHGVTCVASYDEANQTLAVDVVSKPFYVGIGMIESQLKEQLGVPH